MTDKKIAPEQLILTAAKRCYLADGISATGMKDVAVSAGIARSTVYRYFSNRDDLLVATIKLEMVDLNERILKKIARYQTPEELIVEGLILAIKEVPRRPLLRAVFTSDEDSRARRVVWSSNVIVGFGEELMDHVIRPATQAGILQDSVRPEVLVEWVYRLLLSFLTLPSNWVKSDVQLRTTLRALLLPVLLK
jgi:AcrR family transcriptional regulator